MIEAELSEMKSEGRDIWLDEKNEGCGNDYDSENLFLREEQISEYKNISNCENLVVRVAWLSDRLGKVENNEGLSLEGEKMTVKGTCNDKNV